MRRVLVANRGEIAVRIVRGCHDENLEAVAAVSEADTESMASTLADRTVCIGPPSPSNSYLSVGAVVSAALLTGCDAVHPGYGFLSERPALADACAANGLTFVGPVANTIRRGGDKVAARSLARSLGIPLGAGSEAVHDAAEAQTIASEVGYPVLLKAAAGGGGRGMVRVDNPARLRPEFERASMEAREAFGDGRIYVEHYVTNARHVEVQILADNHGAIVHLGDRDCSLQRRYQKLVEEAPAVGVPPEVRRQLADAAVDLARALDYSGAGTVEFLVDQDREAFSFLEINTRLQVEHGVTEMVTGTDIVRAQLRVADGQPLGIRQDEVRINGHAIECRINAEAADQGFRPSPGRIETWEIPSRNDLRLDTHCFPGYEVPPFYDSLLGKLMAWGPGRSASLSSLRAALEACRIDGVETTVPFHAALLAEPDVVANRVNTRWVEDVFLPRWMPAEELGGLVEGVASP